VVHGLKLRIVVSAKRHDPQAAAHGHSQNARTTPKMRALIAGRRQAGEPPGRIAGALGVAEVTVRTWIARHSAKGQAGLVNRSARPHRMQPRPAGDRRTRVEVLAITAFRAFLLSLGAAFRSSAKPAWTGRDLRRWHGSDQGVGLA